MSNGFNSNGKYSVSSRNETMENEMEAFDRLPKRLRDALNYASYKASSVEVEERIYEFPRSVLHMMLDMVTAKNAAATYGPDHPQAKRIQ